MDFDGLSRRLLGSAVSLLEAWFPGGTTRGREFLIGDLAGNPGESLSINTETGKWADFAGGEKGGDLISLYAAKQGIGQGEAARQLAAEIGYEMPGSTATATAIAPRPKREPKTEEDWGYVPVAKDIPLPNMNGAVGVWAYRLPGDLVACYVVRENQPGGKKTFYPLSYTKAGEWVRKTPPAPRPLYNLDELMANPDKPVLVVEGEKAADAAQQIVGDRYVVTTSMNGSNSAKNTNWKPLRKRRLLCHPDADRAGIRYMDEVGRTALKLGAEVKFIQVADVPEGWDLADALAEGWDWQRYAEWAKPKITLLTTSAPPTVEIKGPVAVGDGAQANQQNNIKVEVQAEADAAVDGATVVVWHDLGLQMSKSGAPIINAHNVLTVLEGMPQYTNLCWYDEFHDRIFYKTTDGVRREWTDPDSIRLMIEMQREHGLAKLSPDVLYHGLSEYARRRKTNEVMDWLNGLKWDSTPRLDRFFANYYQAEDSEYSRAVGRNWWISLVARAYRPGCQVDSMPVIIGPQGCGKTRSLAAIGGDWYAAASSSIEDKDFQLCLKGKLVIELSELGSLSKADANKIKAIISTPTDRYREPYGRVAADHPRRSVFAGTTNQSHPLRDETGARRFWPIVVGKVDVDAILRDRDQLFAEAVHRFQAGESWHIMPIDETAEKHEIHREADDWEGVIREWVSKADLVDETMTTQAIAKRALGLDAGELDVSSQRRISAALRVLGWQQKFTKDSDGHTVRTWVRPERVPF